MRIRKSIIAADVLLVLVILVRPIFLFSEAMNQSLGTTIVKQVGLNILLMTITVLTSARIWSQCTEYNFVNDSV